MTIEIEKFMQLFLDNRVEILASKWEVPKETHLNLIKQYYTLDTQPEIEEIVIKGLNEVRSLQQKYSEILEVLKEIRNDNAVLEAISANCDGLYERMQEVIKNAII